MKHPHSEALKKVLDDSSLELEYKCNHKDDFKPISADYALNDSDGDFMVRIKPKPDAYQVFRDAIQNGKIVEYFSPFDGIWKAPNGWLDYSYPPSHYRIHDEYRELREAQDSGKRIAIKVCGMWNTQRSKVNFNCDPSLYKIVDDDVVECVNVRTHFNDCISLRLTKSGIDGKITAEVLN